MFCDGFLVWLLLRRRLHFRRRSSDQASKHFGSLRHVWFRPANLIKLRHLFG